MPGCADQFFAAVLTAGAILCGFCGTFLAFRIQREAAYYRQVFIYFDPAANEIKKKDVPVGWTHFTSAFLLLVLATTCSAFFGFVLPLLALNGTAWATPRRGLVVGGMLAALILLFAYFLDELVHYKILSGRLVNDVREWKAEWPIVAVGGLIAVGAVVSGFFWL